MSSLKWIHFVVILISLLFTGGFSVWCFSTPTDNTDFPYKLVGVFSAVVTVALSAYDINYYQRRLR
jgi:hypothetical protein